MNRRSILIMDTGPIWELVLYRAVKELGFANLRRDLRYFVSLEAYENCGSFLSAFGKKTTSASVVAELYGRIRGTEQKGHPQLWELVYEEFRNMRMDEDIVRLLDMEPSLVAKCGPTDISLIEIARRYANQKPVILKLDGQLHAECTKAQIGSYSLSEACNSI